MSEKNIHIILVSLSDNPNNYLACISPNYLSEFINDDERIKEFEERQKGCCQDRAFVNKPPDVYYQYTPIDVDEKQLEKLKIEIRIRAFNRYGAETWGNEWYHINRIISLQIATTDLKVTPEYQLIFNTIANQILHYLQPVDNENK